MPGTGCLNLRRRAAERGPGRCGRPESDRHKRTAPCAQKLVTWRKGLRRAFGRPESGRFDVLGSARAKNAPTRPEAPLSGGGARVSVRRLVAANVAANQSLKTLLTTAANRNAGTPRSPLVGNAMPGASRHETAMVRRYDAATLSGAVVCNDTASRVVNVADNGDHPRSSSRAVPWGGSTREIRRAQERHDAAANRICRGPADTSCSL
jgi:hypothetical protein